MSAVPAWLRALVGLDEEQLRRVLRNMPAPIRRRFFEEWRWQAHGGQHEPDGDWKVWLMMAGRGFGKTRAGAEWISDKARSLPGARLALVGGTIDDVVKVMIEGESGLLAVARTGERPRWMPSRGLLIFPSGALGRAFSGERPDQLRGPQHHFAWCDEIAKWAHGQACWDNLMLGLRLGTRPQAVVTTTPRPVPVLHSIMALERTAQTGGRTRDNVHLARDFHDTVTALYAGTRLGRQELDGQLVEDVEGALWTRALIERCRSFDTPFRQSSTATRDERQFFRRVVVGVDPPASVAGTCGIVVAGIDAEGIGWVVEDASAGGLSPDGWAERACAAAGRWGADKVVAEANQGGAMVESVLRAIERDLPLVLRHARDAKGKRAEPVHALFERGRVRLAGCFPELEDQLCGLMPGGGYEGPGRSPDRADAMVWALAELMLGRKREPRVRML